VERIKRPLNHLVGLLLGGVAFSDRESIVRWPPTIGSTLERTRNPAETVSIELACRRSLNATPSGTADSVFTNLQNIVHCAIPFGSASTAKSLARSI